MQNGMLTKRRRPVKKEKILGQQSIKIDSVIIGDRVRKSMGDLQTLADSISEHGLLHPIVLTSDRKLVCGRRRIEAAKLLRWKTIPYTEVSLENLLKAERDENEVRKDLLPSEKIAVGRLIEVQEKPKAIIRSHEGSRKGGKRRAESGGKDRSGKFTVGKSRDMSKKHTPGNPVRKIVAKAVGMSDSSYQRADKVLQAAESDPKKFGDLAQEMDETGNISGAFKEMKRRQTGNGRHPMHKKKRYPKPVKMIQKAVGSLSGIAMALELIDQRMIASIKPDVRSEFSGEIVVPIKAIRSFARRLKNG